jgi:hypothetical protein
LGNHPAEAVYSYGYKIGDKYDFNTQMSSTTTTNYGTATASITYAISITIKDIREDTNGHRVDVKYISVVPNGGFMGSGSTIINEGYMEGAPQPFTGDYGYGLIPYAPVSLFVTTDWDQHGTEWKNYITNNYGTKAGYLVQSHTESNGVFTVNINLDFDATHSEYDFNGDHINDAYTGTISMKIEYDSNGVLSSANVQQNMQTSSKGSITLSMDLGRGQASAVSGPVGEILTFVLIIVAAIMAFLIGLFVGKRTKAAKKETPVSPTPPTHAPPSS